MKLKRVSTGSRMFLLVVDASSLSKVTDVFRCLTARSGTHSGFRYRFAAAGGVAETCSGFPSQESLTLENSLPSGSGDTPWAGSE